MRRSCLFIRVSSLPTISSSSWDGSLTPRSRCMILPRIPGPPEGPAVEVSVPSSLARISTAGSSSCSPRIGAVVPDSFPRRQNGAHVVTLLWNVDTKTLVCVFAVRERTRVCPLKITRGHPVGPNLRCSRLRGPRPRNRSAGQLRPLAAFHHRLGMVMGAQRLLLLTLGVAAHQHGDPISLLQRTQHRGVSTQRWPPNGSRFDRTALCGVHRSGRNGTRYQMKPRHVSACRVWSSSRPCPRTCPKTCRTKCAE